MLLHAHHPPHNMQLSIPSILLSLALASTVLFSTANAGECFKLSREDNAKNGWSPVAQLAVEPRQPTSHFFTYKGSIDRPVQRPSKRGIGGFFRGIVGKPVQTYHQTETFTVSLVSASGLAQLPHMISLASTLQDANVAVPTRTYRVVFVLNNGAQVAYWINTADRCRSQNLQHVTIVGDDVRSVDVHLKA